MHSCEPMEAFHPSQLTDLRAQAQKDTLYSYYTSQMRQQRDTMASHHVPRGEVQQTPAQSGIPCTCWFASVQ